MTNSAIITTKEYIPEKRTFIILNACILLRNNIYRIIYSFTILILPLWCVLWVSLNIDLIGNTWIYLLLATVNLLVVKILWGKDNQADVLIYSLLFK